MRKGLAGMERFSIDDARRMAFSRLHVAGLGYGLGGARACACRLADGTSGHARAVDWLLREQIPDDAPGDWRMKCRETRGNGWAFEFDNDAYPDIDDTTIVVLALLEGGDPRRVAAAVERARVVDARDALEQRRLGRLRSRQHARVALPACRSPISAR